MTYIFTDSRSTSKFELIDRLNEQNLFNRLSGLRKVRNRVDFLQSLYCKLNTHIHAYQAFIVCSLWMRVYIFSSSHILSHHRFCTTQHHHCNRCLWFIFNEWELTYLVADLMRGANIQSLWGKEGRTK